jgi:hypothetical protein
MVAEVRAKYATLSDFEKRWKEGLTEEEFKKQSDEYIDSLPWKK